MPFLHPPSIHPLPTTLPTLPPNPAHPLHKPPYILPLPQPLHRIKSPSQLLMTRNPMHITMTSPTQPRHIVQFVFRMPSPLDRFRMHEFRYQMVVCEGYPIAITEFASGTRGFEFEGCGGRGEECGCVAGEDGVEKVGECG